MIELSYDDQPNDVVDIINEELKSHKLIIEFADDVEHLVDGVIDRDDGIVLYELVKLK